MKYDTKYVTKSRRITPWTGKSDSSSLESFIDLCTERDYEHRHPSVIETGEAEFLNSYELSSCRFCGSSLITKEGYSSTGVRRYKCKSCGKRFTILTNTIFDSRKLPISEWICFLLDLFGYASFNMTSKVNRNSSNTTKYWVKKLFLLLEGIQDDVVLDGKVWLDETFIKVRSEDIETRPDGKEYRGQSRNQMCIGIACNKVQSVFIFEGNGKTSARKTLEAFSSHIKEGSHLVHDKEAAHGLLVSMLNLTDESYDSRKLKGIPDKDNPLDRVNDLCDLLQRFLASHSSFKRDSLQDYLNLFSVMMNPPSNKYEKVKRILELSFEKPILMRYRD